jgi:hypothetical protein
MTKKRKFIVMPREKNVVLDGITTERAHREFNGKTYLHVDDPGEARDIDLKYGKQGTQEVFVAEDEQYARALDGEKWDVTSTLKGTNVKLLHNYRFTGVDMTGIRTTRDNGYVWVRRDGKQVRVKRETAVAEGWQIVSQKRRRRRRGAEVQRWKS